MLPPRIRQLLPAVTLGVAVAAVAPGCKKQNELIPVSGKVLFKDQPLPKGVVVLAADPDKGNTTLHEPRGEIDAQGNYELNTSGKLGAPPGWYKVGVVAMKNPPQKGGGNEPTQWLAPPRYVDPQTSQLELEVKAKAEPGSYDLRLKP